MGLDMYLTAKRYLWNGDYDRETGKFLPTEIQKKLLAIPELTTFGPESDFKGIEVRVGYWRKANQIHKWFVDNVQRGEDDCKEYMVDVEQLQELRSLCQQVLDNHDLAETLLPNQAGFFFGSLEYDEWYYKDLEQTIEILDNIFARIEDEKKLTGKKYSEWDFVYHSSW